MFAASAVRSSESTGESCTTCWKFVADVALQRVDLDRVGSRDDLGRLGDFGAQVRLVVATAASSRMRARPCTISRRLPSGSLNILWMWVSVPIAMQVGLARLFLRRVASA